MPKFDKNAVYDYRLEVPEATAPDVWADGEDAVSVWMRSKGARWTGFPAPGTSIVGGKGVLHIRTLEKLTVGDWVSFISTASLSWDLLAAGSGFRNQSGNSYDNMKAPVRAKQNKYYLDEFGAPLAGSIYMSAYAGTEPIEMI